MNETHSPRNGVIKEEVEKNQAFVWRILPLALGIIAIVAIGLLVGLHSASTTVSVRFLGRHFVVARGGAPGVIVPIVLLIIGILIPASAIISAIRTPKSTFASLGRSKGRWVTSMIILFLIGDISLLLVPTYYLLRVRPQLNRNRTAAPV